MCGVREGEEEAEGEYVGVIFVDACDSGVLGCATVCLYF